MYDSFDPYCCPLNVNMAYPPQLETEQTHCFNILRPRQNGRYFADDIKKCIFLNENVWIPIKISLKFVRQGPINNIPALVQIMAWRRPGDKPLSGPMMVRLPAHICVTRPQWVKDSIHIVYNILYLYFRLFITRQHFLCQRWFHFTNDWL